LVERKTPPPLDPAKMLLPLISREKIFAAFIPVVFIQFAFAVLGGRRIINVAMARNSRFFFIVNTCRAKNVVSTITPPPVSFSGNSSLPCSCDPDPLITNITIFLYLHSGNMRNPSVKAEIICQQVRCFYIEIFTGLEMRKTLIFMPLSLL
jgi:hypothetical protein